ncbi:MAG: PQQ-dependent sugar dehydrogenase [Ginsengibacter sp.]
MKICIHLIFTFFLLLASLETVAQKLAAIPYVSGINSPIDLKNCGDDRLFVADRAGRIRVINADGTLRPAPFLNITSKISSNNSEEGFLGIAFSTGYKISGKFYVYYTSRIAGQLETVVEEYTVSTADSNVADLTSALTILTQVQPFSNHNGGNLMFGKDGYLYINLGDGGSGGDPFKNGQNKNTFLAKILRIDVSNASITKPYVVPASNPFYNDPTPGIKKEIWAYGVRNPFKSSIDKLTGDLWIADVGQGAVEEIDYQPADAPGGRNYGWNIMEGKSCYSPSTGCNSTGLTLPIYDYPHPVGFSIIGGYNYRSAQSKSLFGMYIFADYVSKWVDGIRQTGGVLSGNVTHLVTAAQARGNPVSFGEDRYGDQYIVFNGNSTIYKLEDTSYLRRPKAYFTPVEKGTGLFLLQALQGKNLMYQWLKNDTIIPGATAPGYVTGVTGSYTLEVTNTLGFKDTSDIFLLGSSLNLLSFTAQKISDGNIELQWETGSELNITGYTLQRRKQNETVFSDLGFIASKSANGFSNNILAYAFTDSLGFSYTTLFYRLRVEHTDGTFIYSDARLITTDNTINGYILFPNPAKGQVQIYMYVFTQNAVMVLFDISGKKIKEQALSQQNTIVTLPASKEIYIMQVSDKDGNNKVRKKLVVQ